MSSFCRVRQILRTMSIVIDNCGRGRLLHVVVECCIRCDLQRVTASRRQRHHGSLSQ